MSAGLNVRRRCGPSERGCVESICTFSPATARLEIVIVRSIRISPRRRICYEPLDSTHPDTQGTAETIETVSLDLISRRSLRQLMIEVPEFGANVAKLAAAMASDLIWALQERALRSATERLCSALLTLGRPDDGGLVTVQGLSQGDLAGIVGVSRTWVNLTLTELESAGLITRRRLEIRILNPEALQAMLRG